MIATAIVVLVLLVALLGPKGHAGLTGEPSVQWTQEDEEDMS